MRLAILPGVPLGIDPEALEPMAAALRDGDLTRVFGVTRADTTADRGVIGALTASAKRLHTVIEHLQHNARLIEEQSAAVNQSSAATEQMTASIRNVARIAQERERTSRTLREVSDALAGIRTE